ATELNDDRTPSSATVLTTFTILLIDKNDNAPKFNSSEYRVRITELVQVGFALPLSIQVEDKDEHLSVINLIWRLKLSEVVIAAFKVCCEDTLLAGNKLLIKQDAPFQLLSFLLHSRSPLHKTAF
ncbi:cadherin-23 isoform X5, partial [Tachysurus ichikawai]